VLPYELGDGPANMALDEAMLDTVADGAEVAMLRTYGWTVPTLSLGYFQPLALALAEPRWRDVPLVRRSSGGGAIWHHHEVTYTVVIPASHPLARPSTRLYSAVHAAIAEILSDLGVRASISHDAVDVRNCEQNRSLLCFTNTNPQDIVANGIKIVGSAQRRRRGAVLQQGSLLLASSCGTPELPGVCDVADVTAEPMDWSDRMLKRIPDALGLDPDPVGVAEEVSAQARALERTVIAIPRGRGSARRA
jgi:lipoate-protein ligase A